MKSAADSARKSPRKADRTTRSSKAKSAAARDLREEERTPLPPRPRGGPLESLAMALGAGLILAAAFPPLGLWWTAPIALAALNLLVAERGMWAGAGLGLVFGLGLFTPLLHFAAVAMGNAVGWAALTAVESLYLAALGAAWALVSRLPAVEEGPRAALWRVTAFALLWCGAEELRSSWPWGGLPFGRIAFAMADSPVLPFAAYGGSIGVGLLVALSGGCLAEFVAQARRRALVPGLAAAAAAGTLLLSPLVLPVESAPQDGAVRVAAVQGNVAEDFEDAFDRALEVTGNHAEATEQLAARVGPGSLDVVVWPENAADLDPRDHPRTAALVEGAARAAGAPVLVGAVAYEGDVRYNDMVVWTPGSGAGDYYRKHRPVPFAEYIPLRDLVRRFSGQVDRIGTDMAPGTGPQTLTVRAAAQGRDITLAMGICFEVAYDDVLREGVTQGGELIVIPTNNASFLHSSEAAQQLAQGRVQAVIHGRSVIQASTVGITAVISPRGVVEQQTRPYTQASLVADVGLRTSLTVADRLGDWPARAAQVGAAALAVVGILVDARRRLGRALQSRRR